MAFEFESYKVAHDLPNEDLVTFIHHDHPVPPLNKLSSIPSRRGPRVTVTNTNEMKNPGLRLTSVAVLTPKGEVFIGMAGCSESDTFNKKVGFNIAYGRALQHLTWYRRGTASQPTTFVDMENDHKNIGRWIQNTAKDAKLDFLKRVLTRRMERDFKKALKLGLGATPSTLGGKVLKPSTMEVAENLLYKNS